MSRYLISPKIGLVLVALLALTLAACGGGGGKEEAPAQEEPAAAAEEQAPAAEAEEAASAAEKPAPAEKETPGEREATAEGAVTSLDDVKAATVQIIAEGTFRDPEIGFLYNAAGAGSGFIIDPSGLAVTNNHVVTGSALLQVYVGGETDRVYNARVLGVSECSDLAVIDIEGDGFPFLRWYEDEIDAGLDVYAAGFPLGDPEYTLTKGIISKARTSGETDWASVDSVVEHDATINPGNSGGPLVTADGRVVGVNYAGASEINQYFAIARTEALKIIDQLKEDQSVTSIGVNGQAVFTEDTSGIWVASVESGSPADEVGINPGDIIIRLEGLLLATDGTMSDYCDILRSRSANDVLAIEVLRYDTSEILEGRLNSGEQLVQAFSFAEELQDEVPPPAAGGSYSGYESVSDDSGVLIMDVPSEWSQVDGASWIFSDEAVGPSITAAADIAAFFGTWTEPGVFFGASRLLAQIFNEDGLLDEVQNQFDFGSCSYTGRFDYEDPAYTGRYDLFEDCGGQGVTYVSLAAVPEDRSFIISVQIQVVTEADAEALDTILATFFVVGAF